MSAMLRNNLGLMICLGLLAGASLVLTLLGTFMARAGASLRPVYWFAGFIGLILVPQVLGHLYLAHARSRPTEAPAMSGTLNETTEEGPTAADSLLSAPGATSTFLFGPDADPHLITDVKGAFGAAFAQAESARFGVLPNGDTVLLASFTHAGDAAKACEQYLRSAGLSQERSGDAARQGLLFARPAGDKVYLLVRDKSLAIWSGRDEEAIRLRIKAGGIALPAGTPLVGGSAASTAATSTGSQAAQSPGGPLAKLGLGLARALYTFAVVLYFFKGAAWAGTVPANPGTPSSDEQELMRRLRQIDTLAVPFSIEQGAAPNELYATWRHTDERWIQLARASGLRRSFRIRLVLDESHHTVRATDYAASMDWSAGAGGAALSWKAGLGIVFFQYEHRRSSGVVLDTTGLATVVQDYSYTFNLDELKAPLLSTVTQAGWNWRPTIWEGPAWLGWLTR